MGKKALIAIVVLVLVLAAVIWKVGANLDGIVGNMIEEVGTDVLKTRVTVSAVSVDLKEGKAVISGLTVANPPGYSASNLLEVATVEVDLAFNSLPGSALNIQAVDIRNPVIVYEGEASGGSNIQTVLDNLEDDASANSGTNSTQGGTNQAAADDFKLIIDSLTFNGGRVTASSALKPGEVIEFELSDIRMKDIGRAEGGVTTDAVAEMVFRKLLRQTVRAAAKSELNNILEEKAKDVLGRLIGKD